MVKAGCYEAIVQALRTHGRNPESSRTAAAACTLLGVLGSVDGIFCQVDIGAGVQEMLDAVVAHGSDDDVQAAGLAALGAWGRDNDEIQALLGAGDGSDGINAVLDAMKSESLGLLWVSSGSPLGLMIDRGCGVGKGRNGCKGRKGRNGRRQRIRSVAAFV